MNNYKFGNYVCKLREEHNMTQADLAKILDVSDKAVSKWENGQAFPRIDTFERLASVLGTTIEDIFQASKDGVNRICVQNNFCEIMHININGQLYAIVEDECKWIEITDDTIIAKITGEMLSDITLSDLDDEANEPGTNLKDRIMLKFAKKTIEYTKSLFLQVDCVYKIANVKPESLITVELDSFNLGDKALTYWDFEIMYPKIIYGEETQVELLNVKGKNSKEIIKKLQKLGLQSDLGMNFIAMIIAYPLRGLYFKHLCKPRVLKKNILLAEQHKIKAEKRNKGKDLGCLGGCLVTILLIISLVIVSALIDGLLFVDSSKPYLLAPDYSTITYYDDVYVRIDDLPENAYPVTILGATVWEDVRTDGLSNIDQALEDNKVQLYEDDAGNQYLWLIEDYTDSSVFIDDKEYDDFSEHYVYVFEKAK
ncbi:MAG: helix-turn-helix domain-containing protein [Clostridia bacterium]|nr:helix-turn-helix domain-containing protein [Clostridia bacterium]